MMIFCSFLERYFFWEKSFQHFFLQKKFLFWVSATVCSVLFSEINENLVEIFEANCAALVPSP